MTDRSYADRSQPGRRSDSPLRHRSPRQVFDDHLQLAQERRFEEDITRNLAPDAVILIKEGVYRGHDGARELAERLGRELPNARFEYRTRMVEGEVALLEWRAEDEAGLVEDGVDSFVIRDGWIVAQTIHYTVATKDPY